MNSSPNIRKYDALIIGGGFYGCSIALFLKAEFGLQNIIVVEREPVILNRASLINQARVHSGYHYPRSFITAFRSRKNFAQFVSTFHDCIDDSFIKLYAIARRNSYVTAAQFVRFCKEIDAPLTPARWQFERLFARNLIDSVFEVQEYAFDAIKLRARLLQSLQDAKIDLLVAATVREVKNGGESSQIATIRRETLSQSPIDSSNDVHMSEIDSTAARQAQIDEQIEADFVIDCTYSALNEVKRCQIPLKFEIAEMALVKVPAQLADIGVTVMDGPFFSVMPFPSRQLHSLSHVRYTPRMSWTSDEDVDKAEEMERAKATPSASYMLRDAAKFMPSLAESVVQESIFEIKTLLVKNELDDGRPILFHRPEQTVPYYCVLGGKIDNIFDIYEELKASPIASAMKPV